MYIKRNAADGYVAAADMYPHSSSTLLFIVVSILFMCQNRNSLGPSQGPRKAGPGPGPGSGYWAWGPGSRPREPAFRLG